MKFLDEAVISVSSGKGGKGCVSFRREKFIPKGGPDGGDGGDGGSVILQATSSGRTLHKFAFTKHFKATSGKSGMGRLKAGKAGDDLTIEIPVGTVVSNADTGEVIQEFLTTGKTFYIAKGGMGGKGNKHFATSTNRSPRYAQEGESGESKKLALELKLLADVGLIGMPNAGKSTLLSVLSANKPKIGAYPFTTLTPNLGVVYARYGEPFVIADIPGIIENAHKGAGLGIKFLRHIEKTRILVHLIDSSTIDTECPLRDYDIINNELAGYNKELSAKPQIVALTKTDIESTQDKIKLFTSALKTKKTIGISSHTGENIDKLLSEIISNLI